MFWRRLEIIGLLLMIMLLLLPAVVGGQSDQTMAGKPLIGQPLVREGDFALKLGVALDVGTPEDEVEAENMLAEVGVMPKNGWIADYPVTPDIIDELYKAVRDAAASDNITLSVEVALQRLNDVILQSGLSIATPSGGKTYTTTQRPGNEYSPSPTVINNYYQTEGPPTVTYYTPPQDYYYMYGWVPFSFWSAGIWFPGFFILNDFHRTVFIDNRAVFVSNHFRDFRHNRIVRIDHATRFNGSITGTRTIHTRGVDPAVGPRRDRAILNEARTNAVPDVRTVSPQTRNEGVVNNSRNISAVSPSARNDNTFGVSSRGSRAMGVQARSESLPSTSGRDNNPGRRGGFVSAPRNDSSVFTPSNSGRSFSLPSRGGGGFDRMTTRGGNSGSGGGRGRR